MKGDFTRVTFDPAKHFSRVLMQQGRVQLDADWNEQTSILLHYLRTLAEDILGPHAGPAGAQGFELVTANTVREWGPAEVETKWKEIEPKDEDRRRRLQAAVGNGDAVISVGRYYVHGILVENSRAILYTEQPGYPFSPEMEVDSLQGKELLAYLDVWERHITYVQDDHIREVALGGADSCTRAQVIWQVKARVKNGENEFDCETLESLLARKRLPKLRARARRNTASKEPCSVSPESRYRGLENHLYRVEVHRVAAEGHGRNEGTTATFKWSRDNGSAVFPIVSITGSSVVVASLGRDLCSHLKPGDWVEISDDDIALRGQSGPLAQIDTVDRDELTVNLKWPSGATERPSYDEEETPSKHPLLRRWDHSGDPAAYQGALLVKESDWLELEDGVQIWFAGSAECRVGDYWLIAARVATGDIEWPVELDDDGLPRVDESHHPIPAERPPDGPHHYYAPLFHATSGGEVTECRCSFDPLKCKET